LKVAIIVLARGKFSKRIPHKPMTLLMGKPLIEWTLEITDQLPYETHVYTDMKEIKKVCMDHKCFIHDKLFESEDGTHKTKEEIIAYNKEINADTIILLQVTSPFRKIELIKKWIARFHMSNCNVGFAAYKLEDGYYYYDDGDSINYVENERTYNQNSFRKDELFKETGSFYIFKIEQIYLNHFMDTGEHRKMIFEDPYNIDINTFQDLERAKRVLCEQK
jgi:CMP-N-acetylneuraminic acid synthetase